MKLVYQKMPTQKTVIRTVARICKELSMPIPPVVFVEDNQNTCEDHYIVMMDPDWAIENDGPGEGMVGFMPLAHRYWESVIHEVAHWVAFKSGIADAVDHRPDMYAVLIALMLREGIPLDTVWRSETCYRPGSLSRGSKIAGETILESMLRRPPATREVPEPVLVPFPMAVEQSA